MKINSFIPLLKKYRYSVFFSAILIIYLFNMFIDIMEIDAAQYALIAMEMSFTKSFLHVYELGQDYLDKPPLLFWLSSISFLVFGISDFAYKLPSIIIAIVGIYSLYRFVLLCYDKEKAILSALILASSQALFLITNDIRTDTNLLGLVMFSVWQIKEYLNSSKWQHLILASLGIGGAMMAKGPIALIIPAAAYGTDFLLKRQWKNIFKPEWLIMLIVIAITLLPMSYGLYTQFDMHPEKYVYGMQGPSGLRFFYWTQSFGRITGENYWQNDAGYFYFLHTILWDFQPWILLFIPALILKIRKVFINKFKAVSTEEFISLGGFVFIFIALSMSNYKLPHYIFVILPFASIITADYIYQLKGKLLARTSALQFGIMLLFWVLMIVCFVFFFPPKNPVLPTILTVLFFINAYIFQRLKGTVERIFMPTLITAISFNLMMATHFYPNLLKYQANSQTGKMITENKIRQDEFYIYADSCHALNFYAQRMTPSVNLESITKIKKNSLVYIDEKGLKDLSGNQIFFKIIKVIPSFQITHLNISFLNTRTRDKKLNYKYLIQIR